MKVIKHLKNQAPDQRFKQFFKFMPLLTKILIVIITLTSILSMILWPNSVFPHTEPGWLAMITVRPFPDLFIFVIVTLSDFNREQKKGSIPFLISFFIKSLILGFVCLGIDLVCVNLLGMNFLREMNITSWPMMFVLSLSMRDMVQEPNGQRYLFVEPFHLKALFYPIFLCIILEIVHLRIDFLYIFGITMFMKLIKLDRMLRWVSQKIDEGVIGQKMIEKGLIPMGKVDIQSNQIERVVTNSSIILQEK